MGCEAIFPFWPLVQCLVSLDSGTMCTFFMTFYETLRPVTFFLVFEGTCVYLTFSFMGDNSWQKGKQLQTEKCTVLKYWWKLLRKSWD